MTTILHKSLLPAIVLLGACAHASAEPGYYVVTVYDNKDEKSVDLRYWSVQRPDRAATIWPELGFSYGVSARWTTELYLSYVGKSRGDLVLDSWNWQNDYLLTQGQYPLDVALHSKLSRAHDPEDGYTLELGPALQTDLGKLQLNGNAFFERSFRSDEYNSAVQMKYQWQGKYRWKPAFQPGWQGFGELGDWNHWAARAQQSHRIGPALFGSVALGGALVKYQAAYLFGKVGGKRGEMLSVRVQWLF